MASDSTCSQTCRQREEKPLRQMLTTTTRSTHDARRMPRLAALSQATAVLLGAALLFQIQPIAGKLLLPRYGGAASVWVTCLFFFQAMLLAGYGYAHILSSSLRIKWQVAIHCGVIVISFFTLPVTLENPPLPSLAPLPAASILLTLAQSIGIPVFILASTAPLVQRWSSAMDPARSFYGLYAISNAGALAALASYPLLVEPHLSLPTQSMAWSALYGGYAIATLIVGGALRASTARDLSHPRPSQGVRMARADAAIVIVLAACGVLVLLSVTTMVTQNISSVPFLWILPLTLYLVTYIACFAGERWYERGMWSLFFIIAFILSPILYFFGAHFEIASVVASFMLLLLASCMICHGELYRLRPAADELTRFYFLIALGGALGGGIASLLAPLAFNDFWEFPGGLYLLYLTFGLVLCRRPRDADAVHPAPRLALPEAFNGSLGRLAVTSAWLGCAVFYPAIFGYLNYLSAEADIFRSRNFYGTLTVKDIGTDGTRERVLVDGTTIHGIQQIGVGLDQTPTGYYRVGTGLDMAMSAAGRAGDGRQVGIVGLGAGTVSAYGSEGDLFRYYELNPDVVDVAHEYFSFLGNSAATTEIVIGDARLSLQRELEANGSRQYDALIIDAFSSDAIPTHLLTREAFELYLAHLEPHGVLAMHISNVHFDLAPPVGNLAAAFGKDALLVDTPGGQDRRLGARWVLIAGGGRNPDLRVGGTTVRPLSPTSARLWTDDYCDLLSALR